MLCVNELSKQLDCFRLNSISFHLPHGYIMGLIGENGAGKSSLVKTILHVYEPDSGEVTINGRSMANYEHQIKDQIGTVLDENFFEDGLSAQENGSLFGSFYQNYEPQLFLNYLKAFEIDPKRKLKKLSKGMQLKFQLAFALSHHAVLFLMDEPTASLDPSFRKEFLSILTDLVSDGERSVLLSTHLTEDLDRIADYIAFLHQGTLQLNSTKEDLLNRYQLAIGEPYKIKLLPKELVIWCEQREYSSRALIKKSHFLTLPDQVTLERPKIDDIMYYMLKGGFHNV